LFIYVLFARAYTIVPDILNDTNVVISFIMVQIIPPVPIAFTIIEKVLKPWVAFL